jgi:hypothetical protein
MVTSSRLTFADSETDVIRKCERGGTRAGGTLHDIREPVRNYLLLYPTVQEEGG